MHNNGNQQRHHRIKNDPGAGLHHHRANRIHNDEVAQPLGINTVASAHKPHKRQQHSEQMHADIAGLRKQELRTATSPHRTIGDVLAVHEMRKIVDERLEPQMDGEPLHNAHGEEAPAASAEPSGTSESQLAPIQQQPPTHTTHPTPAAPAIPQSAPQSPPSAPSWDVPSADSSATFPDVL